MATNLCVIMVDPAMSMLEIEEIPTIVNMDKKGTTNKVFHICSYK